MNRMIAPRSKIPQIHGFCALRKAENRAARLAFFLGIFLIPFFCACAPAFAAQAQSPSTTWTVTIVLPKKVVAGQPATLAVLGVDGRLAPGVAVEVASDAGSPQRVVTDPTGRAYFTTPFSGSVLIARVPGGSAAALIDSAQAAGISPGITTEAVVSLHDRFSICGSGLRGDADAILVRLNREPSLVIAASPECIVVLPSSQVEPGPTQVSVEASGNRLSSNTTLVALDFESPDPALVPGTKSRLLLRVNGSDKSLHIAVDNKTPGVLRFLHGDVQEVLTTGGSRNYAMLPIEVIRSGDFSFHARLLPAPDAEAARGYLQAAATLAPKDLQREIGNLTERFERHPRNSGPVRQSLEQVLAITIAGDFRTLLEAADSAL
jgi:hypothetical protein